MQLVNDICVQNLLIIIKSRACTILHSSHQISMPTADILRSQSSQGKLSNILTFSHLLRNYLNLQLLPSSQEVHNEENRMVGMVLPSSEYLNFLTYQMDTRKTSNQNIKYSFMNKTNNACINKTYKIETGNLS